MARACVRTNTLAYNTLTHASHARLSTVAAGRGVCGGRTCPTDSVALRLSPPLLGRLRHSQLSRVWVLRAAAASSSPAIYSTARDSTHILTIFALIVDVSCGHNFVIMIGIANMTNMPTTVMHGADYICLKYCWINCQTLTYSLTSSVSNS